MTSPHQCQTCGQPLVSLGEEADVCLSCLWIAGSQTPSAHPGWTIPGHDLILEISRGGMGVIYKALEHHPKRVVALKMLLPVHCRTPELQDRFRVEVAALAQLDHPGILPLYQYGEVEGVPYFTMKLAVGGSLAAKLKSAQTHPSFRVAAQWMERLASTLQYAHQHSVLHRDIKPGNILFDETGEPSLGDFGLAKLLDGETQLTEASSVMGTPSYMPPEVAEHGSKAATTSSDIYSLGAVFYELLTGRPPFLKDGMAAMVCQIRDTMPPAPRKILQSVPRDLEVICMTCLAKDPAKRYPSASELAADVRRWINGKPILARRASPGERVLKWARRKPGLAALSCLLMLTAAAGTLLIWQKNAELRKALAAAQNANVKAEKRARFLLGSFANSLEDLGRVDLLVQAWRSLDETSTGSPEVGAGALTSARLLVRWSRALLIQGDCIEAESKARKAMGLVPSLEPDAAPLVEWDARKELGRALADQGQYEQAAEVMSAAGKLHPWAEPDGDLRVAAETSLELAELVFRQEQSPTPRMELALENAQNALIAAKSWQGKAPEDQNRLYTETLCLRACGIANYHLKNFAEALNHFERAKASSELLCKQPTAAARWIESHADLVGWAGQAASDLGKDYDEQAVAGLNGELDATIAMLKKDPGNARLGIRLGDSHCALQSYWRSRNQAKAKEHCALRLKVFSELWKVAPAVREVRIGFSSAVIAAVDSLQQSGSLGMSGASALISMAEEAEQAARREVMRRSWDSSDHKGWSLSVESLSKGLDNAQTAEQSFALLERAEDLCRSQILAEPANASLWQWDQATLLRRRAELYDALKNRDVALKLNRNALQLRVALLKKRWRPDLLEATVPRTYSVIVSSLSREKLFDDTLDTAQAALECWLDCPHDQVNLEHWLSLFASVIHKTKGNAPTESRRLAFAQRVVKMMERAVMEQNPLNAPASQAWEYLKSVAAAGEPIKTGQAPSPVENLSPTLEMVLPPAQRKCLFPGSGRKPGEEGRVVLQRLGILNVVIRTRANKTPGAMRHQLVQMMPTTRRDEGDNTTEHGLDHRPAPAFPQSGTQIVDHDVEGIEERPHVLATCGNQLPAAVVNVIRPALRHLAAPAKHAEPRRVPEPEPFITEREIVREFVRIRSGYPPQSEGNPVRPGATLPERKGPGINIVARHDPFHRPARTGQDSLSPVLSTGRKVSRHGFGNFGFSAERPEVTGLQGRPLSGRNIDDALDQAKPHRFQLTSEMPHHLAAPNHPEFPLQANPQHPVFKEITVAQGNGPSPRAVRNVLRQAPADIESSQKVRPDLAGQTAGIPWDHGDIILPCKKTERVVEFCIRAPNPPRPVEPEYFRPLAEHVLLSAGIRTDQAGTSANLSSGPLQTITIPNGKNHETNNRNILL